MRLVSLTPRKSLGARLDDLLSTRFALQTLQEPVVRTVDLTLALQQCLAHLDPTCVWRAYRAASAVFCAIARRPVGERGEGGELEVYFVDANAWVYSAALWAHEPQHGWYQNSVLDASYDDEHGWWLGALLRSPTVPHTAPAARAQDFLPLQRPAAQALRVGRSR